MARVRADDRLPHDVLAEKRSVTRIDGEPRVRGGHGQEGRGEADRDGLDEFVRSCVLHEAPSTDSEQTHDGGRSRALPSP
jgi:hypothetical protein